MKGRCGMYEFLAMFEEMLDTAINNMDCDEFDELKKRLIERLENFD